MNLAEQNEQNFREWNERQKQLRDKSGWTSVDGKIGWLKGSRFENTDIRMTPIKELLLEIPTLTDEESKQLHNLPENLFSLNKDSFILVHNFIKAIINKYKVDLKIKIEARNISHTRGANYGNFKYTNFAEEYLEFLNQNGSRSETNSYIDKLRASKNLILRGAPGTGKTYLAKEIAKELTGGNEEQIGFVQFHPSYDYTDFVEGLRPILDDNGQMAFVRQDGIFKAFCKKAKEAGQVGGQDNFNESWDNYLEFINEAETKEQMTPSTYLTVNSRQNLSINYITGSQGTTLPRQYVYELYRNPNYSKQTYYRHQGRHVLKRLRDFGLKAYKAPNANQTTDKKFVFIIDEINRGEISKIFGELFFAIDPGYRGEKGTVTTQYANMNDSMETFYVPENVYIIGTMNDIDRSVDTFDFAMRRRFRFVEVTAEDSLGMWDGILSEEQLDEAKVRLTKLNQAIENLEELNRNYHVGPSYFLTLPDLDYDYDTLWQDYLAPLLEEYLRGTYGENEKLEQLQRAYNLEGQADETDG